MSWGHRGGRSDWESEEQNWNSREQRGRRTSDERWKHDKFNERQPRQHQRNRDNWSNNRGGSWGSVDRKRDRSRSPPRYDRHDNDRRYDRDQRHGNRNRNDDSKWPSAEEREMNISSQQNQRQHQQHHHHHHQQHHHQHQHQQHQHHHQEPPYEDFGNYQQHPKTTLIVSNVPQSVTAEQIKAALELKQVYVRSCQLASTREPGEWSGIGYIEMGRVADASFIVDECKGHLMVNGNRLQVDYADTSSVGGDHHQHHQQRQVQHYNQHQNNHHHQRRNSNFPSEPTDTMIVRGLDGNSDEKSIQEAFGYITKKNILDIRLARDRQTGHSRGFAFITWECIADCKQVLEYLQKATPKFNIDGQVVMLDYANGLPAKSHELKAKAANDAIAAAQSIKKAWTDPNSLTNGRGQLMKTAASDKGIAPHHTPHLYPHLPAEIGSQAPPQGMIPPIPPDQIPPLTDASGRYRKYPNPNYALFQWLQAHQMYYDPSTGLMWDPNSQYFYNQYKQLYLYWDETQDTFVPVDSQQNLKPVANPQQQLPGQATIAEQGKKTKAVDVQKQMESWMKQQKKTKNKPMSVEEAEQLRRQKKLEHTSKFKAGSFGTTFQIKTQPQSLQPPPPPVDDDMMKTPPPSPPKPPKVESPIKVEQKKSETSYTDEETYLDWTTFKCLLCRRALGDENGLRKHINKSKLHRENLDKLKHPEPEEDEEDSDAYKVVMQIQEAMGGSSYRDRAKERRNKFVDDIPPGERGGHEEYSGPAEQPTVNGIGNDNRGAQLLQKMGWTGGTGLGKNRQGIVNPIEAGSVRENKTAGLGAKATLRQTPRSGEQYKKKIRQLTQDRWNDAGHG